MILLFAFTDPLLVGVACVVLTASLTTFFGFGAWMAKSLMQLGRLTERSIARLDAMEERNRELTQRVNSLDLTLSEAFHRLLDAVTPGPNIPWPNPARGHKENT